MADKVSAQWQAVADLRDWEQFRAACEQCDPRVYSRIARRLARQSAERFSAAKHATSDEIRRSRQLLSSSAELVASSALRIRKEQ